MPVMIHATEKPLFRIFSNDFVFFDTPLSKAICMDT